MGGGVQLGRTEEEGKVCTTLNFGLAMLIVNFVGVVCGVRGLNSVTPFSTCVCHRCRATCVAESGGVGVEHSCMGLKFPGPFLAGNLPH